MFDSLNGLLTLALQELESTEVAAETAKVAADAAEVAREVEGNAALGGTMLAVTILLVIIGPFVLGGIIANALKVREWAFRFGLCLFAFTLGATPFIVHGLRGDALEDTVRLGIDLAGGTNMVFQVMEEEGKPITDEVMDKMVGAVGKRINPSGTEEITVRQVGRDRIEVIVPGEDPQTVNEIKARLVQLGSLEFYITANAGIETSIVQQAMALDKSETELFDSTNRKIAIWVPAYEKTEEIELEIDGRKERGKTVVPQLLERNDAVRRTVEKLRPFNGRQVKYETEEYLLIVGEEKRQVSGKYLTSASVGMDQRTAGQIVNFRFNQRGAFLFTQLTSTYKPQPGRPDRALAIVLDRKVFSAPNINGVIGANGQISGDFTLAEARELTAVLNAGALEVPINKKPLSEATVDPTLGEDVRVKGVRAIFVAGIVVVLFMLFYYRFAGIVAVTCLLMNLVLVLGVMVLINATFTLPGLAGFVLTIGMAVDANVLIFERMREEVNRGSSLRMAIQNGFGKAFSTIVDANVTTLITAVILFMIGTDQVKGFAVTLFIGIVMSMFTALYVGRLIFDVAEKKRWISTLSMFSIVGETHWNFLNKRVMCAGLSVVLIAAGLSVFVSRSDRMYDIDFTGGTMVTFQLTDAGETEAVQEILAKQFGDGITVERLTLAGDDTTNGSRHFRLRTIESDSDDTEGELSAEDRVRNKVYAAFKDEPSMKLLMVSMTSTEPQPITVDEADESAEALMQRRFNGGHSAEITFGDGKEVAVGTISDMLTEALGRIPGTEPGSQKYPESGSFIQISGLEGSGSSAGEYEVHKFNRALVRSTADISGEDLQTALSSMQNTLATSPLFDEVNTFASAVASEMKQSAVIAIIISLMAIVLYIWARFQNITFGFAAVVALVHDVLIVLGAVALGAYLNNTPIGSVFMLSDFRINLPMVAAFLTIVGYSLNDTIVVFDRIREVRGKNPELTDEIVNTSLNQTLSRTLLTSLTTFIVVMILYVIGGEGIHGFAYCLTIGVIVGTYSSIYVASPVLIWLMNRGKA